MFVLLSRPSPAKPRPVSGSASEKKLAFARAGRHHQHLSLGFKLLHLGSLLEGVNGMRVRLSVAIALCLFLSPALSLALGPTNLPGQPNRRARPPMTSFSTRMASRSTTSCKVRGSPSF